MTAALALHRDFPEIPQDVLQAVYRHTIASEHMEPLDMVIYAADCLEPSRQSEEFDALRSLVGKVSLEELFFRTYGFWTTLVIGKGRTVHPCTARVYNHYAVLHKQRKEQERAQAGLAPVVIDPNAVAGQPREGGNALN